MQVAEGGPTLLIGCAALGDQGVQANRLHEGTPGDK